MFNKKINKNIFWMFLFVIIAVLSIIAVAAQSNEFSTEGFGTYVKRANLFYIALALVSMFGFIFFEGLAVVTISKAFGYERSMRNGFVYSASDIYFSAITPSATGGQPVCAWFMMKHGIPGAVSTVILVTNLIFYTLSILIIGLLTFILAPDLFLGFSIFSKILISVGYAALLLLLLVFVLVLKKEEIVHACSAGVIKLLARLKILKRPEAKLKRLEEAMAQYKACSALIVKNKRAMLVAFCFNFLQRASQIAVTMFVYLAMSGNLAMSFRVWLIQSYAVIGSNCVPVPGAMGVSDYLLLDGFGTMLLQESVVHLELLSRGLSFYSMVLLCGITTLVEYILINRRKRKKGRTIS